MEKVNLQISWSTKLSASKLDSSGMCSSGAIYNSENSSSVRTGFMVPLENQNGVSESAAKLPSKILELMDGFRASKVRGKNKTTHYIAD